MTTKTDYAKRNADLVAASRRKPTPTWEELGRQFGISRQMAAKIIARETGKSKPRSRTVYRCAACRANFHHESGYIGRYCPKHRGKYRGGKAVEKLTTSVKCGWKECQIVQAVSISAFKRGRGRYCSREHRNLANAERLRKR